MNFLLVAENSFLIELLEKGGLPALALGICFTIFMLFLKSQAKQAKSLQLEREDARKREAEQYNELMRAYEDIVKEFITLSKESTMAITRLSERVGQCPLRGHKIHLPNGTEDITDG